MELKYMNNQSNTNIEKIMQEKVTALIDSGFIYSKLDEIAKIYNINIDQIGELNANINKMLLGIISEEDFIPFISKDLEINIDLAGKISEHVNSKILSEMRIKLREDSDIQIEKTPSETETISEKLPPSSTISSIEKAGQFTIDKEMPISRSNQYNDTNLNRDEVLKSIEDKTEEVRIPLVDHLLTTPVKNVQKIEIKEEKNDNLKSKATIQAENVTKIDPYREIV